MPDTLPSAQDCCLTCSEPIVTAIPGPPGEPCTPCADGAAGDNAWSLIDATAPVAVPTYGASAVIALQAPPGNRWMAVFQTVFIGDAPPVGYGYYQVTAVNGDGIHATVKNLGDGTSYPDNINGIGTLRAGPRCRPPASPGRLGRPRPTSC